MKSFSAYLIENDEDFDYSKMSEQDMIAHLDIGMDSFIHLVQNGAKITDKVILHGLLYLGAKSTVSMLLSTKRPDDTLTPISDNILKTCAFEYPNAMIVFVKNNIHIDPDIIKIALLNIEFIINKPLNYAHLVKEYFKDNALLMNKWLRYAQHIRDNPT